MRHGHRLARGATEIHRTKTEIEAPRGSTEAWTLNRKTEAVSLRPLDLSASR